MFDSQSILPLVSINSMTTNAFQLKHFILEKLINIGIQKFQITLESTEHSQEYGSTLVDSLGTFRNVWQNLLDARDSFLHFKMVFCILVTPENVLDVYELVEKIKEAFGCDARFSIFFKMFEDHDSQKIISFNSLYGKNQNEILQKLQELVAGVIQVESYVD